MISDYYRGAVLIRRVKYFILICACVLLLGGCTQVIESVSDELRFNRWKAENENGTQIFLSFDLNRAEMEFVGADEEASGIITGPCIVSDSGFIITDTSMGEIFYFTYTLSGDKVTVEYQGQKIEFFKIIEENETTDISGEP